MNLPVTGSLQPDSQLAVKSNNDSDLTPCSYCIASRLVAECSLCASVNVCASVCFPVGMHFR